jgi:predicted metal-dependent phosphoesterase TrpH
MADLLRVEFHCHTIYSKDSLTRVEDLLAVCHERQIDRVVITDHNTIDGALEAKGLAPEMVIIGEEIMTQEGELLAAFVKEAVPGGLPAQKAIALLRDQGAFISVSHPFDRFRPGHWKILELAKIVNRVDAVEVFNSRCFPPFFNLRAAEFAREHGLLGTVGSDAHTLIEIGRATMLLPPFEDAESLRQVFPLAEVENRLSGFWVRVCSRYAVLKKMLGE